MKSKFLKAVLPVVLLGSPALSANSVRSGSRWKVKKVVAQSGKTAPEAKLHAAFENPFGGFGGADTSQHSQLNKPQDVLGFLAEEGLLQASNEAISIVSGSTRKEFLVATQCVAGATFNGKGVNSVSSFQNFNINTSIRYISSSSSTTTTTTTTTTTFNVNYASTMGRAGVNQAVFNNALVACQTPPPVQEPTQVPTLSQWMLYLLMTLLALVGTKSQWLGRFKNLIGQKH